MQEMTRKKKFVSMLAIAAMLTIAAGMLIAPISARDLNIADNQNKIYYSGGEAYVTIPMSMLNPGTPAFNPGTLNPPAMVLPSTTTLGITLTSTVDGSDGPGTSIGISVPWTTPTGGAVYVPNAYFANVPDSAITLIKALLAGYPSSLSTNTRPLSSDFVIVERHGNSITAQLTQPQTILYAFGVPRADGTIAKAGVSVTIPSFTIELNKVGGDVQRQSSMTLLSGWTQDVNKIGFDAKGTIAFADQEPLQLFNSFITMHGNTLWTLPPKP